MSYQDIIYDKSERVATLTFNRPERLNAITNVMRSEILEAMKDASEDDDIRVVVIRGQVRVLCGADLAGGGKQSLVDASAPNSRLPETAFRRPLQESCGICQSLRSHRLTEQLQDWDSEWP